MTDSPAAKALTETFLNIIRQQRHLGVRLIISTQEPTVSPRLIDLCSLTIIHRFTSPEWYKTIEKHIPIDSGSTRQHGERVLDGFRRIASLRTGEAIVFASSAHLVGEDGAIINTPHETFKMMIRNRVTWDGGRTIMCIR
jgi:DNA helicase HerA-like ATPase